MCSGTDRASITIEYNSNSKLRRKRETKSKSKKKTAKNMCTWISCRLGIKNGCEGRMADGQGVWVAWDEEHSLDQVFLGLDSDGRWLSWEVVLQKVKEYSFWHNLILRLGKLQWRHSRRLCQFCQIETKRYASACNKGKAGEVGGEHRKTFSLDPLIR